MARKLILTRADGADRVLEALEGTAESALTVVAPRGSALADRDGLARISEAAAERGVAVAVESVDEELLALAHAAHLETVHPFFRADRRHLSLDGIAPGSAKAHPRVPVHPAKEAPARAAKRGEAEEEEQAEEVRIVPEEVGELHRHPVPTPVTSRPSAEAEEQDAIPASLRGDESAPRRRLPRISKVRLALTVLVAVAVVVGVGEGFLRGGGVSVTLAETPWEYTATVTAGTSVTTTTVADMSIPGQLFPEQGRSIAQSFPATGSPGAAAAPAGAKPRVTVHNESTQAETFVVRTRFQGKSGIFRAATAVSIPAAKKEGDKLVPGSATVEVTPDSDAVLSGAEDGERLSVPGLAGTDKASLFYATLAKPAAQAAEPAEPSVPPSERVVTAADEEAARAKVSEVLANTHRVKVVAQAPGLTVVEGAVTVEPTQLSVSKDVDEEGNFSVVGQANVTALAFREEDLRELLLQRAQEQAGISYPVTFREVEISYANPQPAFGEGRLTFTVTVKGKIVGKVSDKEIQGQVAGKSRGEAADWIEGQPAVAEGSVTVRPFWRFKLPENPEDVWVEVR